MINGLLDQLVPDVSDDEDDDRPDTKFIFQASGDAQSAGGAQQAFSPPPRLPGQDAGSRALIVCGPGAASAFVLAALAPLKPMPWRIDVVKEQAAGDIPVFPQPPKSPTFYLAGSEKAPVVVAMLSAPVPTRFASAWSEALMAGFDSLRGCNGGPTEVMVLDRLFRQEFRGPGGIEKPVEPHVCGLWNTKWSGGASPSSEPPCPGMARLSTPNLVDGFAAAILTHCEAESQRCLVAFSIQDGAHMSESTVRAFARLAPVLQGVGALPSDWQQPDYKDAIRQVVPPMSMSIYA